MAVPTRHCFLSWWGLTPPDIAVGGSTHQALLPFMVGLHFTPPDIAVGGSAHKALLPFMVGLCAASDIAVGGSAHQALLPFVVGIGKTIRRCCRWQCPLGIADFHGGA